MKQSECKEFLPIITAWSTGKKIQLRAGVAAPWKDVEDGEELSFDAHPDCYRIKPVIALRPWRPEEVPVGCLLSSTPSMPHKYVLLSVEGCLGVNIHGRPSRIQFEELLSHWKHSIDDGETWKACGVEEAS